MAPASKTTIDRAGQALAKGAYRDEVDYIQLEETFDDYRRTHLEPLTATSIEIQGWLTGFDKPYYVAQRLKRKPQILRKLKRLSVRLSQLQDIGGARIIVPTNSDVESLQRYITEQVERKGHFRISRRTDYREKGRDRTGYRALHFILERDGVSLELQLRSRVQHYWAESIERTSVIYGHHLKEEEGDPTVLRYFQMLSDAFYEFESGRQPSAATRIAIDELRQECEQIISSSPRSKVFDSFVNEGVIRTLVAKEGSAGTSFNNWIIVFDWNSGSFVFWDIVSRRPEEAVAAYVRYERDFTAEDGYEVVLIGSSDVATVRNTHSHYFGVESYETILESLETSIVGFRRKIDLDVGARQILHALYKRHFWGGKTVSFKTLKNHYLQRVLTFDDSLRALEEKGLVHTERGVSLNLGRKADIEQYL
jgi:ppGpp synthetase/RelA/SpoT-type nucleotidyltranferase